MTGRAAPSAPTHRDLPVRPDAPRGSSWGVWGVDDEIGTLNLLTPQDTAQAARLVRTGEVFALNWDTAMPSPPLFAREPMRHTVSTTGAFTDDRYDSYYPQGSSQWDALSHVAHPEHGHYNGVPRDGQGRVVDGRLGIQHVARRGIAGRFVLADVAAWRTAQGRPIDAAVRDTVSLSELTATLDHQGVAVSPGAVLLIRFGWIAWYEQAAPDVRRRLAEASQPQSPGLEASADLLSWLWDQRIAVIAADNPGIDATPISHEPPYASLHHQAIPLLGMAFGELFLLDALAASCARDGRYDGLFTAAPLNTVGGTGSPANALALK